MQPTPDEIEIEKEALRDLRRRSVAQVASLDPDLPSTSSAASGLTEDGQPIIDASDPSHLFWVPAHVHPELDPGEFKAFIKDHANLQRALSNRSQGSMSRKRSMLSKQYRPTANDTEEQDGGADGIVKPRRRGSYRDNMPTLTLEDLQKLEDLAEQANDPEQLRNVLRRSLSLSAASSDTDDIPLVPQSPGQILRRTARTKIRKAGAGALGFTSRRAETLPPPLRTDSSKSDEVLEHRLSFSEESSIFDSYAQTEESSTTLLDDANTTSPPLLSAPPASISPPPVTDEPLSQLSLDTPHTPYSQQQPVLQHPTPQQPDQDYTSPVVPSVQSDSPTSPPQRKKSKSSSERVKSPPGRKEKEKKGLFGLKKVKEKDKERDKESSFFGSFFGGSKKKQDDQASPAISYSTGPTSDPLTHAKTSKSRSASPARSPPSPILMPGGPYARYPIAVERAVYRLSHIKLANPRRPLLEQVLISNLMFWYLGVINKQNQPQASSVAQTQIANPENGHANEAVGTLELQQRQLERQEKERREREEQERKDRMEAREREKEAQLQAKRESGRRGSLTKAGREGHGSRRAEIPVRGPQYEIQHLAMEQEYGDVGSDGGRSSRHSHHDHPLHPQQPIPVYPSSHYVAANEWGHMDMSDRTQPYPSISSGQYIPQHYYTAPSTSNGLPPGAMKPAAVEHSWASGYNQSLNSNSPSSTSPYNRGYSRSTSPSPPGRSPSPSSDGERGHHKSSSRVSNDRHSPPPSSRSTSLGGTQPGSHRGSSSGKISGRSLSATAVMSNSSQHYNRVPQDESYRSSSDRPKLKKRPSAGSPQVPTPIPQSQVPDGLEEEDVPLAIWQEQQQRSRRR